MSFASRGVNTYRQTQVQSRTPVELVVMLYDGALQALHTAREAMERRDVAGRRESLDKVLAIVAELQCTLNTDKGGEIAASLDRLYEYVNLRLLEGAMKNDITAIDEVSKLLDVLRDAWKSVAQQ
jgi:flagellar protein FliS